MKARGEISDVFKTVGQPSVTYVKRDNGRLEKQLAFAVAESGQLCLVTGPSKTGKTTLYREVLAGREEIPLVVQCDRATKTCDIWKRALETVDFSRVESTGTTGTLRAGVEAEASGKLGWRWLAEAAARLKGSVSGEYSDNEIRRRVLSDPGPDLLIPILQATNYRFVVEDFHYLDDHEKVLLFQQWKRFIDNEVSVLVLGTTHRAVDIASSNRDLVGRIAQIDVGHWDLVDLETICQQGFEHIKQRISAAQKRKISAEAVGLPIIVQQVCLNLFVAKDIQYIDQLTPWKFTFKDEDVSLSLHNVARQKYTQFESYYSTLIRGPREKSRKYRTYELVLACFTLDPIKFSLRRAEIDERLGKLDIAVSEMPPPASLNSTLGALKKFQERRGFDLLEWRPGEEVLYIIEPAFLFYVRWRTIRETKSTQLDLFEKLLTTTFDKMVDNLVKPETVGKILVIDDKRWTR